MEQTKWHQIHVDELHQVLDVDPQQGLTEEEAEGRRKKYGMNELSEGKRISPIILFLNQFKDFMVLILMGATLVSGLLGEYLDAVTIIAIILLNGVLGFVQEFRAERSLRHLDSYQPQVLRCSVGVKWYRSRPNCWFREISF